MGLGLRTMTVSGMLLLAGCPGGQLGPLDAGDLGPVDVSYDSPAAPFRVINRCFRENYVNAARSRYKVLVGSGGYTFDPACVRIQPGQSLDFSGMFITHNLLPGKSPDRASDPDGDPGSPITPSTSGTTSRFTFTRRGFYPFYCSQHYGNSMIGVVWVE
jgi:plastocyanin